MEYGFHRVITPKGVVPQSAYKLDNTPAVKTPHEILVSVETLNLDSTSMREIRENHPSIEDRIFEIVKERGKMHNPATNSGGVLMGKILKNENTDEQIVPLASLSTIPLYLNKILSVRGDLVRVEGKAVLFQSIPYAKVPPEYKQKPEIALSALDISSIVPQVNRTVREKDTVLVIGTGKAGITAMAAMKQKGAHVIGTDYSAKQLEIAKETNYADKLLQLNAQQQEEFYNAIENATAGKLCDVVINCVNVPNTEATSILSAKERGKVLFFSMATQFDKAALGTDATGKDVEIIIGNGIAQGQAEQMFALLRNEKKLREYFERQG